MIGDYSNVEIGRTKSLELQCSTTPSPTGEGDGG
jgi:hypothetical protein